MHLVLPTHGSLAATRPGIEAVLTVPGERFVPHVLAREDDAPMLLQWLHALAEDLTRIAARDAAARAALERFLGG